MLVVVLLFAGLLAASLLDRAGVPGLTTWPARMRVALAVALVCIGADHLWTPERYLPMLPEVLPAPRAIILFTGVCEIAGALGLLVPRLRRLSGVCLAAYFVAVLPANVKVVLDADDADTAKMQIVLRQAGVGRERITVDRHISRRDITQPCRQC